jgi:hypothetical protein
MGQVSGWALKPRAGSRRGTASRFSRSTLPDMKARGWEAAFSSILIDDSADATIAASLAGHWDCNVIGGGIRIPSRAHPCLSG